MAQPVKKRTLVVGYNESPEGRHALRYSVDLANALGADVEVIHVADAEDFLIDPDMGDWEEQSRATSTRMTDEVADVLAQVLWSSRFRTSPGDVAKVLHEAARGHPDCIVVVGVPASTPSPLTRLISRSVQHQMTHHVECPVLLVPAPHTAG